MAQTAVEWLEARVAERIHNNQMESPYWHLKQFIKDFEQAKQIERERIEKAYNDAINKMDYFIRPESAEEYYTKTYKQN